ncbi:phosphorylase b kinase gamma catalytic chain, skeletal muscle/heart isoform-like [Clytia hemisphaerica]|uniref:phosphorylase b kinase gamma catalytic chain, skeletal muscle/heart isoform-like n=1 Tax=Clytia hemisphaerica TaxID=252671 RepID=UPI0034D675CC|eukprot:TCONS_00056295-protein
MVTVASTTPHVEVTAVKGDFYAKYEPGDILGDGISSVVRKCRNKENGEEFAVKIIDKFSKKGQVVKGIDIVTQIHNEVEVLSKLQGYPGIIKLVDFYDSSAFMFLVFELAKGGELFDLLTQEVTIHERTARRIMWQLFHALYHMHENSYVHRDLKPENVLLDSENNVLLSDFGFAHKIRKDEQLFDVLGTPAYFAPETLKCVVYDNATGYGKPVDLWACGVILYTLLVGQGPFWHRKDTIMYRKIMEGKYSLAGAEWEGIGECPQDLISQLLVVDPSKRINAMDALCHPWFKGLSVCHKCEKLQQALPKRQRIKFKVLVCTIMTMKKLYYTFHERFIPQTYSSVLKEPYNFKDVRKIVDSCSFNLYGHWVKKTTDNNQSRTALFENTIKNEIVSSDTVDGQIVIPTMYAYGIQSAFLPKRPSFIRKDSFQDKGSSPSSSYEHRMESI